MATRDAQKRAFSKYAKSEKGKEALSKGAEKYQSTENGQQKIQEAQARFESTEARKEYKRKWMKDQYQKKKAEKENNQD